MKSHVVAVGSLVIRVLENCIGLSKSEAGSSEGCARRLRSYSKSTRPLIHVRHNTISSVSLLLDDPGFLIFDLLKRNDPYFVKYSP